MNATNQYLHEVVITAIVRKDGKYLITKRSASKKRFPSKWTVPGGRLESGDYALMEKETEFYWYNVLEKTLRREVLEEVGLEIDNIHYVTSLATIHEDGSPSIVISCGADYVSGVVKLQEGEVDTFEWVTLEQAQDYDLIDGIYEELSMAEDKRKGRKVTWSKSTE